MSHNRLKAAAFCLSLMLIASATYASAPPELDIATLSEDKVNVADLSKPNKAGKTFVATTLISAPLTKLCGIILNFQEYPSFMPNTDKAVVVEASEKSTPVFSLIDMTLKLPLGKVKKYRLKMEPVTSEQACQLSWKLVPRPELSADETIADTSGYWKLSPHPSKHGITVVQYYVYSDPGPVPFGLGWIVDTLGKDSLPKTLEALRTKSLSH